MDIIVGLGDYAISNKQDDILKTYALSSCVGVTMYCPVLGVAGMIHVVLPDDQINNNQYKPSYYATTGVPLLLHNLESEFGCKNHNLVIRLYGGADSIQHSDLFCIGRKNIYAVTTLLSEMKLNFQYSGVGGKLSRTIEMEVATGNIKVFTQPIKI